MDIKRYINIKKVLIDKALDKYLPLKSEKPQKLHEAMRYSVFSGGKRIRPILSIASFEACGGKGNSIMPIACAIEFIHTYTLIHDDLPSMDDDDYRRGKATCHKRFNEPIALLAGDALLTLSFKILAETLNPNVIEFIAQAIGSSGTIGGQAVDILEANKLKRQKEMRYIVSKKTGALFEAAIISPGIFIGASKKKINALKNYARYIGVTFQLIDDLMDKDGYYRLFGEGYIKRTGDHLTKKAKSSLSIFGKKAWPLSNLAGLILERKS